MEEDVPLSCLWTLNEAIVFLEAKALDGAKELSDHATRFVNVERTTALPPAAATAFAPAFATAFATHELHHHLHHVILVPPVVSTFLEP